MTQKVVDFCDRKPAAWLQSGIDGAKQLLESWEVGRRETCPQPVALQCMVLEVRDVGTPEAGTRNPAPLRMIDGLLVQVDTQYIRSKTGQVTSLVPNAAAQVEHLRPREVAQERIDAAPASPSILIGIDLNYRHRIPCSESGRLEDRVPIDEHFLSG
jgi:hypothetical protein